jgi:hypothetical protein
MIKYIKKKIHFQMQKTKGGNPMREPKGTNKPK